MDIKEKQARWAKEKPLFEAEFIHSHLLPFFNFNENTGDYEIKVESLPNTDDEDRKVAYESLNTGWAMWLRAKNYAKAQVLEQVLNAPACVGGGTFQKGVKWSTVIGAAQRHYENDGHHERPAISIADQLRVASGHSVVVPKEKLMQIIGSVSIIEPITRGNPYMDSIKRELTAITDVVKTVIEAQEQNHEHS